MAASKEISWPAYSLVVLAGFVVSYFVGWAVSRYYSTPDVVHRSAGGVLQLLGVLTIALGISQMRRMFGLPNTFAEMIGEWADYIREISWRVAAFFGKRRHVSARIGGVAGSLGLGGLRAHGHAGPGPSATLEDRVRILEEQYAKVSKSVFDLGGKIEEEARQRTAALQAEQQARKAAHEELERLIKSAATGAIRLQSIGVIWFLAGISLATWAPEIP